MKIVRNLTATSAIAMGMVTAALAAAATTTLSPQPPIPVQAIVVVTGPAAAATFTSLDAASPAATVANAGPSVGSFGAVTSKVNTSYLAPFNNGKPANGATWFGATVGDGKYTGTGWPKTSDMQGMIDLGVKTVRLPFAPRYCINPDGTLNNWVLNTLAANIKFNMLRGVSTVLDAHTYLPFTDSTVASFWSVFAPAIENAIGGATPLFGIELANEPGKSSKDLTVWTEPLRKTIKDIRSAGYKGYIFAGAGDWDNMTFLRNALVEVERTGGVTEMDPLNRTIYTGHDYWNKDADLGKTRNDLGSAVDGNIKIAERYNPSLLVARRIGAKVVMSEIGGGISPTGPLPAFNGVGKNGKQLQEEYFTYAKANQDVLIGTWFWMAGKAAVGYRHKIEAGNPHTKSLQTFW
ncbi:MAG: hypothetical protein EOO77_07870 [Oxalobacteraceae bacterium]|nr:MAG: hypothetical protein EOO77_07870 [Oxalobacteraceae bacterium]